MRLVLRVVASCMAVGCGPAVQVPADTDGGDGEDSRTAPMGDASTLPSDSGAEVGSGGSVPGDPTDAIFDVGHQPTSTTTDGYDPCEDDVHVGPLRSNVMMLVDVSQTMSSMTLDHDGDPDTPDVSRWSMVVTALHDHVPALAEIADVGVQPFPSSDVEAVPSADACRSDDDGLLPPATAGEILGGLPPQGASFVGATPTAAAFEHAQAALGSIDEGTDRRILLLTDSAPNCGEGLPPELFTDPDADATALVEALRQDGISTHVIGIDVAEGTFGGGPEGDASTDHRARLEELATAGDVPLELVDDAAGLDLALAGFTQAATSCRFRIPSELLDYPFVDVSLAVEPPLFLGWLDEAECAAGMTGFHYLDVPPLDTIELCGEACVAFQSLGFVTLRAFCGVVE